MIYRLFLRLKRDEEEEEEEEVGVWMVVLRVCVVDAVSWTAG